MLPKPVKWSLQVERTSAIISQLSGAPYDVVMLQEAFIPSFRNEVTQQLKQQYPYSHYLDRGTAWFPFLGSGLFVLSRHPIQILDETRFDKCEGFDCFASKGSLLIEVSLPGEKTYQVVNTHLQAGAQNGSLRLGQLEKIRQQLNKFKKVNVPQLLAGDLNIDFSDPEFITGLAIMQMNYSPMNGLVKTTNARTNDCYSTPEKKLWIDHVWFDKSLASARLQIEVRDFSFNYENRKCPSSDHHAVELRQVSGIVSK
jgi:endonuclease/exonuclease/phosphatase family metal-dependent hydrolase